MTACALDTKQLAEGKDINVFYKGRSLLAT